MKSKRFEVLFGNPTLTDNQVEKLHLFNTSVNKFARTLTDILPEGGKLDEILEQLYQVKAQGECEIRYQYRSGLTKAKLCAGLQSIEKLDKRVARVWMNAVGYADLLLDVKNEIDPSTQLESLAKGKMGKIWNTDIMVGKKIQPGSIVCIAEGEDSDLHPEWTPSPEQCFWY